MCDNGWQEVAIDHHETIVLEGYSPEEAMEIGKKDIQENFIPTMLDELAPAAKKERCQ